MTTPARGVLNQIKTVNMLLANQPSLSIEANYLTMQLMVRLQKEHHSFCCVKCGMYRRGQGEHEHEECTC